MRSRIPLFVILVVAAVARFWAIGFCLPSTVCRPDEEAVASIAINFFARDFNPHFFDWPSLFMYVVAIGVAVLFQVFRLFGWIRSEYHFLQWIAANPAPVFLIARIVSATAGVATVWLVFKAANRLFGRLEGFVAALFLALAFLPVRDSHFGVTDVAASFFVVLSFMFAVRLSETGATRDAVWSAIAAGLAASTKYNAALAVAPALWVLLAIRTDRHLAVRVARCAVFLGIAVAVFVAGSPYVLLDYSHFSESFQTISGRLAAPHGIDLGWGWRVHFTSSLRYGMQLPHLVMGLAGMLALLATNVRKGVLVAIFPVVYYVIIGSGHTVFARYIEPVVPFMSITAAFAVCELARWLATRRVAWRTAFAFTMAALVIAPSAWSVVRFDLLLARDDSRGLAARWIARQYPNGASVAQTGVRYAHVEFMSAAGGKTPQFVPVELGRDTALPDLLIVPSWPLDRHAPLSVSETATLAAYSLVHVVDAYDAAGTGNVYDWQDEFYLPLEGFRGIAMPGPNLKIYARTKPAHN